MNSEQRLAEMAFMFVGAMTVGGLCFFRAYTRLSRSQAFLAVVASALGGTVYLYTRLRNIPFWVGNDADFVPPALLAGACFPFLAALALRVWGCWVGGKMTPEERQPGAAGVRAWFCTSNVIVGVLIVALSWGGFGISPLLSTVALGALLAAYPLLSMEASRPAAVSTPVAGADLSPERDKILAMLEAGKINVEESAELLQALNESARPSSPRQVPLTGGQRLMLIGAALVLLGFFLPWFVINPGKEMSHALDQFQSHGGLSFPNSFSGEMKFPMNLEMPTAQFNTPTMSVSGGDIGRGLGWAALALAVVAAILPYVATNLDVATARSVRLLCLGVGGLIVLYLLTQNLRFVGVGLVVAVSGYALEITGALRERRTMGA